MKWQPIAHWSDIIGPQFGSPMLTAMLTSKDLMRHVVALEQGRVGIIGLVNMQLTEEVFLK